MMPAEGEANLISSTKPGPPRRSAAAKLLRLGSAWARRLSSEVRARRSASSLRLCSRIASSAMGQLHQPLEATETAAAGEGVARELHALAQGGRFPDGPGQRAGAERDGGCRGSRTLAAEHRQQPLGVLLGTGARECLEASALETGVRRGNGKMPDLAVSH